MSARKKRRGCSRRPPTGQRPAAAPPAGESARAPRWDPASPNISWPPIAGTGPVLYKPMIAGFAKLHYVDAKLALDDWQTAGWLAPFDDGGGNASWEDAVAMRSSSRDLDRSRRPRWRLRRSAGPGVACRQLLRPGQRVCRRILYETARARLFVCDALKAASKPGESEGDFRARLALAARERRDAAVADLRKQVADQAAAARRTRFAAPRIGASASRRSSRSRRCRPRSPSAARSWARCSAERQSR